jgi:predicted dehydrogenase
MTARDDAKTYTAAVIGVGAAAQSNVKGGGHRIGYTHGQMYRTHPRTALVAAADINRENLDAFAKQFEVPRGFLDHGEMLAQVTPDIVSICTWVGPHRRMIEDAARAGAKAIFCEKPFVASPVELQAVRDVVRETGVKLAIAHVRRYRPSCERIRQLIREGAIGTPVLFAAGIEGWDLSEWGSHWLDIFRFFLDDQPVTWVMGQARVRDQRGYGHAMEEHAVAYFAFENGCRGLVDGGRAMNGEARITLAGTDGMIRLLDEDKIDVTNASGHKVETFDDPVSKGWHELWQPCVDGIVEWLDGGDEPRIGFTYTGPSAELNLAAYVSMVRGDRVDLPLTDMLDEWPVEVLARRTAERPAPSPSGRGLG